MIGARTLRLLRAVAPATILLLAGCARPPAESGASATAGRPADPQVGASTDGPAPLILIGIDALRWDFPELVALPALESLRRQGVSTKRLIPAFPTKTFPNFYTLVTGLYPEHHGLVGNRIHDPRLDADFSLYDRASVEDGRWYGGEPIWVTAERQGVRSATYYWPGSAAEIGGFRPSHWRRYDGGVPNHERVAQVLRWLDLPIAERPRLILAYFSTVDDATHVFPPGSSEVISALVAVDEALAGLLEGLDRRGLRQRTNVILVSDHGMAPTSPQREIAIDGLVDPADARVLDENPLLWVWPRPGRREEVYAALHGAHPHLTVYRKEEIPERYHYRDHHRIAPLVAIADEGWSLTTRSASSPEPTRSAAATHGYDNRLASMGATLIASGPAFRRGVVTEPIENVHLYPLLCRVLALQPADSDGDLAAVADWLEP